MVIDIPKQWRGLFLLIYLVPIVAPIFGDIGLTWISSLSDYRATDGLVGLGQKCAALLLWLSLWWLGSRLIRGLCQIFTWEHVHGHQRAAERALAVTMGLPFLFMLFMPWWKSALGYLLMIFAIFGQGLGLLLALVIGVMGILQYLRRAPF